MGSSPTPPIATAPQEKQIQTRPPATLFHAHDVPPSQYLYLQDNDFIGLSFIGNVLNTAIVVKYRYLTPQGEVKEGTLNYTIVGFSSFTNFTLGECWLLSLSVEALLAYSAGQWTFVQVVHLRTPALLIGSAAYSMIWEGYIPSVAVNGWPGSIPKEVSDGAGTLRAIVGTTPAAGADIDEVVPNNRRWQLLAFSATLVTSATVANRNPGIRINDGSNHSFRARSSVAQTATQTVIYSATPGQPFYNDTTGEILLPLPTQVALKVGWHIQTDTPNLQAGDQWSSPKYMVIEWAMWDV